MSAGTPAHPSKGADLEDIPAVGIEITIHPSHALPGALGLRESRATQPFLLIRTSEAVRGRRRKNCFYENSTAFGRIIIRSDLYLD